MKILFSRTNTKRYGLLFIGLVYVFSLGVAILRPLPADAAAAPYYMNIAGRFINRATLRIDQLGFSDITDTSIFNEGNLAAVGIGTDSSKLNAYIRDQVLGEFKTADVFRDGGNTFENNSNGCESKIAYQEGRYKLTQLQIKVPPRGCIDVLDTSKDPILPYEIDGNQEYANSDNIEGGINGNDHDIWFTYSNANTMTRVDGIDGDFVAVDDKQPNRYFRQNDSDGEQDYVDANQPGGDRGVYHYDNPDGSLALSGQVDVRINGAENLTKPGTSVDNASNTQNCEQAFATGLNWAICGALGLMDSILGFLQTQVQQMLTVKPEAYNDPGLQQVWSYFRNIASILLLIIGLVMVIGQAVGRD